MKSRLLIALSLAVGIAVLLVTGCSKSGSGTVAQVGKEDITVKDFADYIANQHFTYQTAQEEFDKKRELLDTLIVTRMLAQAAYERGLDKSEEIARVVLANKDKFLLDVLYQKQIIDKAPVSDAEVKAFYDKLEFKVRASQITVNSLDTANFVLSKLTAGENFDELAYKYSTDPGAKRNRGDLGYFTWGTFGGVPEFEEAVFKLEPGEVSPPIKSKYGYHIIKLLDRQPNETRIGFEAMRESIYNQILNTKRTGLLMTYLESLKAKYPINVDKTTCDYLLKKREQIYPPQLLATLPKNDFDDAQLDRNEKELVLATWEGGQVTVFEYLTLARQQRIPAAARPNFDAPDSLASFIFQVKLNDVLTLEANRMGLENDDGYKQKIKIFKEWTMADVMRNDSIPKLPAPDDATTRKYYDEHPDEFTNPAKVHVYEILLGDEIKAQKLAKQIRSLEEFKKYAGELTERASARTAQGDLGYVERQWFPEIFDASRKISVGSIGGPVVTLGKYSVFYVVDKMDAQLKDFLGVKRTIVTNLLTQQKNDEFQQWVKDRKASMKIVINDDAIWGMIDKTKYASADTTAAKRN
jgi:parvulin-like peptidyl-prolyl isomerase